MARNVALIFIFLISVSQLASFSTARNFPGETPAGVIFSGEIHVVSKSTVNGKAARTVGCEGEDDGTEYSSSPGVYVNGKYWSLVLNVLPKGSVPASGPSKRINDVKT